MLLNIILEALFVSNLWIFFYTSILTFLNSHFPAKINKAFLWVQSAPEPFEISLYLILTFLFVLAIVFFHRFKKTIFFTSFGLKVFLIVILSILLIYFIGGYPMAGEFDPYPVRSSRSIYFIITIVYILAIASLLFINLLVHRILKKQHIINIVIYSIVFLIIGLVTFDARFPMTGHDYEYFLGPAWEVISGKTVYTDILSRYAFL